MFRRFKRPALYSVIAILTFAAFLGVQNITGNFHAIVAGEAYRSAQPGKGEIARYKQRYGIKSIINLRGENIGMDWYDTEVADAKAVGIKHINFRMKAERELTREQALELIKVMRDAPKPVLIHCLSGADRTGLAGALYLAAIAKKSEGISEHQLSLLYGHMPFYINAGYAMDRTFNRLKPEFGF